ncbi:hypothetical protein Tfer_3156 [Thermincola ferriacetica]|uniref:Uncharacterized protein n=1 Tax=Thermincola ferriacetica TaxID=281456 RepID=A0A0L6VZM3_9FIRM|nr:hypothetical protein Tfer_3156 [Thermincola ferriacetica]
MDEISPDVIEKKLIKSLIKSVKMLNLFTVPQAIWLIELYYLMLNSFLLFLKSISGLDNIISHFPKQIFHFNSLILGYFQDWSSFVFFLSVGLFLSGIIISMVTTFPYISNYKMVIIYSGYGVTASIWLFLIWLTYKVFNYSYTLYPLIIIFLFYLFLARDQMLKIIKKKFGSSL